MTDAARMHDVTAETRRIVDLVLDYSRERLLAQDTPLDKPLPAAELSRLAGRTISEEGVGAERALGVFTHVLAPACITTDDPRYLSFIPTAPTKAAAAFDLVVSASALVSGLETDARLNTVSGDIIVDGITGDLSANAVSGDVQIRGLTGTLNANSVSGEVAATGSIRKATIDTVSGNMLVDSTGRVDAVSLNTVSGDATVRIDEGHPANFVLRSVSGRLTVDGIKRSTSGPSNYVDSVGELSGSFVDVRANSVSGDVTVIDVADREPLKSIKVGRYPWGAAMRP